MAVSSPPVSPRSFADDRALLLGVFTEVVASADPDVLRLHEETVELARRARGGSDEA
ncbi:MAG: hypothetical protein QOG11_147, partial [Solirubrobacteraceae bacterium]|nr:hypothetical protein [Solirubrobacteraceae bacterium]